MIQPHRYPRILERSRRCTAVLDGEPADVIAVGDDAFISFSVDASCTLEIALDEAPAFVRVAPESYGLAWESDSGRILIRIEQPVTFLVELPNRRLVFVYARAPEADRPKPHDERVYYFRSGQVYEVGELQLTSGETVYLEAGAVVRGAILAQEADDVCVRGPGIIDNAYFRRGIDARRTILFDRCRNVRVEDVTLIRPTGWMIVLGGCDSATVRNVNEIGKGPGTDGIDIVGSRNIEVSGCLLRNGDDNIAIKALDVNNFSPWVQLHYGTGRSRDRRWGDWRNDVENVSVSSCAFYNDLGGTAMEIGYETRCDHIRNIRFADCDVLAVHGHQSVFGIHNGDRAEVSNVTWENIRVEHHYDKLIDIRRLHSRWNWAPHGGPVHDVLLKDIDVFPDAVNEGYSVSIISGFDPDHPVGSVTLENIRCDGRRITSPHEIDLCTRDVESVIIR